MYVYYFNIIHRYSQNIHMQVMLDILACVGQFFALLLWPILYNNSIQWSLPTALLFISSSWWQNYIGIDTKFGAKWLLQIKKGTVA